jgi:hypothetical protein
LNSISKLNLTAARTVAEARPSACRPPLPHVIACCPPTHADSGPVPAAPRYPTVAPVPHAIPSPSSSRGRLPPPAPLPLPSPATPLKGRFRRCTPFLSLPCPHPFSSETEPPHPVHPGRRRHSARESKPPLQPLTVSSYLQPSSSSTIGSSSLPVPPSCCKAHPSSPPTTGA